MMSYQTLNVGEEYGRHFGPLYQKFSAPLGQDLLSQLGNASEATECLWETFGYFFKYMEGRPWDDDEKLIKYRLRMIAGGVCTKRLAEKSARHAQGLALQEKKQESLFDRFKCE